jgi:hypothetical protein
LAAWYSTGERTVQRVSANGRNGVFAQAFGQGRSQRSVEFSFPEKGFDGGAGGHISSLFPRELHYFAKLSLLYRSKSESKG